MEDLYLDQPEVNWSGLIFVHYLNLSKYPQAMIKTLKLQKAIIAFILGVLALIAYKVMSVNKIESSNYMLSLAGILFIAGALMLIYPIIFAKKDKGGCVELDSEIQEEMDSTETQMSEIEAPLIKEATKKVVTNEKMGEV